MFTKAQGYFVELQKVKIFKLKESILKSFDIEEHMKIKKQKEEIKK